MTFSLLSYCFALFGFTIHHLIYFLVFWKKMTAFKDGFDIVEKSMLFIRKLTSIEKSIGRIEFQSAISV